MGLFGFDPVKEAGGCVDYAGHFDSLNYHKQAEQEKKGVLVQIF